MAAIDRGQESVNREAEARAKVTRMIRESRAAGRAFAAACAASDVEAFFAAVERLDEVSDGWRHAMRHAARLVAVSEDIRAAFVNVWIEHKMLPLKVGHRPTLAAALRRLLPGGYAGVPLRLYRGAGGLERRQRRYGFSWTTERAIANRFAVHYRAVKDGGVVLETIAPPEAILLIRRPEGYYDEGEVVADSYRIGRVRVVQRLRYDPEFAVAHSVETDWTDALSAVVK